MVLFASTIYLFGDSSSGLLTVVFVSTVTQPLAVFTLIAYGGPNELVFTLASALQLVYYPAYKRSLAANQKE